MTSNEKYDVIIIGGGAAGLSAAVTLARARRRILVVDAGSPRNAPAAHAHNYLGLEGIPPLELLAKGRAEARSYGAEIREGTVESAQGSIGEFVVDLGDGSRATARRLLITTGLTDELPDVPGVAERWGLDVLHCPFCHGWEVRDDRVGILGSAMGVHQALMWRQWADRVVLFTNGFEPTAEDWEKLAARDIEVVDGTITELVVRDDALVGARVASGSVVDIGALVVRPNFAANTALVSSLGVDIAPVMMGELTMGTAVTADFAGATSVPGVFAAGNVVSLTENVIGSAAAGGRTGGAINGSLIDEDVRLAVDARARV